MRLLVLLAITMIITAGCYSRGTLDSFELNAPDDIGYLEGQELSPESPNYIHNQQTELPKE